MRRGLLVLGLLMVSAQASLDYEFAYKIIKYEKHWDPFVRKYFGCQLTGPTTVETCKPSTSELDYANFRKACEAAKELYRLTGSCT